MRGPGQREEDAVGDLLGGDGLDPLVDGVRLRLVAVEADDRELGLDEARVDRGDPDRAAEQVLAERVAEAAHGELRGDVRGAVRVRLAACDRPHEDDVAPVADVRQREPRDPEHAVDVRVQHRRLVVGRRLGERRAAEREPRVVEEDVDPAERLDRRVDERAARRLVRDVERQGDVGLDPLDPPRAADDADARVAQLPHGRGADPRRRAGDDGGLAVQIHAAEPNAVRSRQRGSAEPMSFAGPPATWQRGSATATAGAFRGVPAREGRDRAAGIRSAESCSRS